MYLASFIPPGPLMDRVIYPNNCRWRCIVAGCGSKVRCTVAASKARFSDSNDILNRHLYGPRGLRGEHLGMGCYAPWNASQISRQKQDAAQNGHAPSACERSQWYAPYRGTAARTQAPGMQRMAHCQMCGTAVEHADAHVDVLQREQWRKGAEDTERNVLRV